MNAAVPQANSNGDLLLVRDTRTRRKWLVDGGAFLSIRPPTEDERRAGPSTLQLQTANGGDIKCFGEEEMSIHLGDRAFRFKLVIGEVKYSILGADFLANFYLAPNHRDQNIIDLNDFSIIDAEVDRTSETCRVNFVGEKDSPYYKLLDEYPSLSTPSFTP